jgi:hypothetical protein
MPGIHDTSIWLSLALGMCIVPVVLQIPHTVNCCRCEHAAWPLKPRGRDDESHAASHRERVFGTRWSRLTTNELPRTHVMLP